ncbi:MAG TPA: hypothetical protein VG937_03935 [Polyangiaceae bacterium]|jgi:hypothetical protein|nr:hypothetical protein [Polyangiaceae bacterium]
MHLRVHSAYGFEPAPAWLVSNGEMTVGPVATHLLVRGFLDGRIPPDCRVQPESGGEWRALDEVREIRAARAGEEALGNPLGTARQVVRWLSDARDQGEAMLFSLHGACSVTQASVGALYRVRPPIDLPVVSACYGDALLELGEVVPRRDPAFCLAHEGEPTVLLPESNMAARAVALRLCPDRLPAGLAIIPIRAATELAGVVELARFDHPFRASEVRSLVPLMAATVGRMEELAWDA